MRKIEIKKGDNTFIFKEPFANDLLEYKIKNGEYQTKLLELQERSVKYKDLKEAERTDADNLEVTKLVTDVNLLIAQKEKLSYDFAVKNLIDVNSKDYSIEEIINFQVPIYLLEDIVEAFAESITSEALGKPKKSQKKIKKNS